jgi:hypothetical protein
MGEPYPCKARMTVLDTLINFKIIDNKWVHCNNINDFTHSRYIVTVHERIYAQKYLDEQQAIKDKKDAEAKARADARELEQELRRIEDEKKKAEEKRISDQQEVIIQTVITPIADIPVITELTKPKNYKPKLSLAPKDNNTMIILLGALGLIGLFVLKKK